MLKAPKLPPPPPAAPNPEDEAARLARMNEVRKSFRGRRTTSMALSAAGPTMPSNNSPGAVPGAAKVTGG